MREETHCLRKSCAYSGRECPHVRTCPAYLGEEGGRRTTVTALRRTEEGEQRAVMQYCKLCDFPLVHIPNEGKRTASAGARLKAMGLQKGFPDLFLPEARRGFHGLFIEMKRDRTQKPTKEQEEWIKLLNKNGYLALVCYCAGEAIDKIQSYMSLEERKEKR